MACCHYLTKVFIIVADLHCFLSCYISSAGGSRLLFKSTRSGFLRKHNGSEMEKNLWLYCNLLPNAIPPFMIFGYSAVTCRSIQRYSHTLNMTACHFLAVRHHLSPCHMTKITTINICESVRIKARMFENFIGQSIKILSF